MSVVIRLLGVLCLGLLRKDVLALDHGWDTFAVTFGVFSQMPTTEGEAENNGWIKDSSCEDDNVFVGNRYVKGGDKSTRLIFDENGDIAGIQATVTPTATFPSQSASSPWVWASTTEALLTAYFRNPKTICTDSTNSLNQNSRNQLYIQVKSWLSTYEFKHKILTVPKKESAINGTNQPWVKGKCFNGMGLHYWYNMSLQLSCDDIFPVFLMYDETTKLLKAFGWAINTYIESPRWLHPTAEHFPMFFDLATVPTCLANEQISTQHIYLSDPNKLICAVN